MRVHAVDCILKPSKVMCSLFRQVDKEASDPNILATTCPVTVSDESLAEGSTSRRQSFFVPQEDSEESDDSSISAMLDVLAPENSQELWMELCDRQVVVEGRSEKETELLIALAESYLSAQQ